jgi:transposase
MQIKYLAEQGVPKSRIAQHLGVSRQTVYNHLCREGPFPKPPCPRTSRLDAFKEYVRARLEQFDLPATVLLAELKQKGYRGGLTILREFVRPLKDAFTRRVTERFETLPGHQAQIDWGECGHIRVGDQVCKLYVFVMVLGYSRMMYARFTTCVKLPVLLGCLKDAFRVLGIPRQVLVDNMKQAVEQHDVITGVVRFNRTFLDFAEHFGFLPVACPPYWPRVKGKVERGVGFVKESFLEGRCFVDLDDLNRQLSFWLDSTANVRTHGTTQERPIDRFARELPHLRPFAAIPALDVRPTEFRVAPPDSHISFEGVRYSVDPRAVGHTVIIRPDGDNVGDTFCVYWGDTLVAKHQKQPRGSRPVTLLEHQQAIRRLSRTPRATSRLKREHFLQVTPPALPGGLLSPFASITPAVEVRPLTVYEQRLGAVPVPQRGRQEDAP